MNEYIRKSTFGFNFKFDAQKVGERFKKIEQRDGSVTPVAIVVDAKKKTSPYHNEFDWNDKSASYKWHLHTARNLIRCVHVVIEHGDEKLYIPAYTNVIVTTEDNTKQSYINTPRVMADDVFRQQIIDRFEKDIELLKSKYSKYEYLAGFFQKVEDLMPIMSSGS